MGVRKLSDIKYYKYQVLNMTQVDLNFDVVAMGFMSSYVDAQVFYAEAGGVAMVRGSNTADWAGRRAPKWHHPNVVQAKKHEEDGGPPKRTAACLSLAFGLHGWGGWQRSASAEVAWRLLRPPPTLSTPEIRLCRRAWRSRASGVLQMDPLGRSPASRQSPSNHLQTASLK